MNNSDIIKTKQSEKSFSVNIFYLPNLIWNFIPIWKTREKQECPHLILFIYRGKVSVENTETVKPNLSEKKKESLPGLYTAEK